MTAVPGPEPRETATASAVAHVDAAERQPPAFIDVATAHRTIARQRSRSTAPVPSFAVGPPAAAREESAGRQSSGRARQDAMPPAAGVTALPPRATEVVEQLPRLRSFAAPPPPASRLVRESRDVSAPSAPFAAGVWPSLPDEPDASKPTQWPPLPRIDFERRGAAASSSLPYYDRGRRLLREQRGESWSE